MATYVQSKKNESSINSSRGFENDQDLEVEPDDVRDRQLKIYLGTSLFQIIEVDHDRL